MRAVLGLVVAAFFWGTTFVVVQDAIERVEPMPFLAVRFALAASVLGVVVWFRRRRQATPGGGADRAVPPVPGGRLLGHGAVAGLALTSAYVLQTLGLLYTTPSRSAFITYLLVVLVPVFGFVFLRRRPHPATALGIAVAVVGLLVLTGVGSGGGPAFGWGEVLTLGCAAGFAAHLLVVAEVTARHDPVAFAAVQVATVAVVCFGWASAESVVRADGSFGGIVDGPALAAAAFTGVFATAVAFVAMVWAQRRVAPARAALILLLEPVFAALLDLATGGSLPPATLIGGGLILAAVAVAEVLPVAGRSRRPELSEVTL